MPELRQTSNGPRRCRRWPTDGAGTKRFQVRAGQRQAAGIELLPRAQVPQRRGSRSHSADRMVPSVREPVRRRAGTPGSTCARPSRRAFDREPPTRAPTTASTLRWIGRGVLDGVTVERAAVTDQVAEQDQFVIGHRRRDERRRQRTGARQCGPPTSSCSSGVQPSSCEERVIRSSPAPRDPRRAAARNMSFTPLGNAAHEVARHQPVVLVERPHRHVAARRRAPARRA